jgi:hypothetical protein
MSFVSNADACAEPVHGAPLSLAPIARGQAVLSTEPAKALTIGAGHRGARWARLGARIGVANKETSKPNSLCERL